MSYGLWACDWQERINNDRLRKDRLARARAAMKERGLSALVCMDSSNVRYITGTATPPWMVFVPGFRYCLLVEDADPLLWEHGDIKFTTMKTCPWLKGQVRSAYTWIRGQPGPQTNEIARMWAEDIKEELKARGYHKDTIGLDVPELASIKALESAGISWVDGQTPMLNARVIKTNDEIECLRIAAAITEAMFAKMQQAIKPGVREVDLVGLGHQVLFTNGLDGLMSFTICSGPNTWPNFKYYTDRMIRPGDIVTIDVGGAGYNGYKECYYRTFSCGRASQKHKEFYAQALEWMRSAIRATRPGARVADLVKDWPDATKEWGYESEWEAMANEWGHGLGLSLYEPPTVSKAFTVDHKFTLKENMSFALETQQGSMKDGGVRIEEMLAVTSSGVEVLSKYPVEDIIECTW
jgi:Xaa-Pro dipeptidase